MFDQARSVLGTALAIGAVLLVFWIIGSVATHATGWAAVGHGIHTTINAFSQIVRGL